jgi:hypothetical protein
MDELNCSQSISDGPVSIMLVIKMSVSRFRATIISRAIDGRQEETTVAW